MPQFPLDGLVDSSQWTQPVASNLGRVSYECEHDRFLLQTATSGESRSHMKYFLLMSFIAILATLNIGYYNEVTEGEIRLFYFLKISYTKHEIS